MKTKIGTYLLASWVKNMPSKPENPFEALFSTPEGTNWPQYSFYMLILISDKKQKNMIYHKVCIITKCISKTKNYHPFFTVLADFTKLGSASKRAIGKKKPASYSASR